MEIPLKDRITYAEARRITGRSHGYLFKLVKAGRLTRQGGQRHQIRDTWLSRSEVEALAVAEFNWQRRTGYWYTVPEAARVLRVSIQTVHNKMPTFKASTRRSLVRYDDVERAAAHRSVLGQQQSWPATKDPLPDGINPPAEVPCLFDDLLAVLTPDRRAHSLEVGRKVAGAAALAPSAVRAELAAAAVLHDIGYGYPATGFHPLDGARFLAGQGFSATVCNLVAHHSASVFEADERGIDRSVYDDFTVERDLSAAEAILWWADMTTGPAGQTVSVEERLEEIEARYGPGHVVSRFVGRARDTLLAAGQSPIGSIHGSV